MGFLSGSESIDQQSYFIETLDQQANLYNLWSREADFRNCRNLKARRIKSELKPVSTNRTYSCLLLLLLLGVGKPMTAQVSDGILASGGMMRTYKTYLPKGYDPQQKYPLILLLHGRFGTGAQFLAYSNIAQLADRESFIVVAPDGYRKSWNDGRLRTPAHEAEVDDVKFLSSLINRISSNYSIDPQRIYCMGMSNGGFMTLTLAAQMPKRLAAIGVFVASASENNPQRSIPTEILPLIVMNGTEDPLIKWNGGPISNRDQELVMATSEFLKRYTQQGDCDLMASMPLADTVDDGTTTILHRWLNCSSKAEVQLWEVKGGGHTIPGKKQYLGEKLIGRTARDYDGLEAVWSFLKQFRREE
jgi:polyhydroxybutyrate depolymerase